MLLDAKPLIASFLTLERTPGGVRVHDGETVVDLEGPRAARIAARLPDLDGDRTFSELALAWGLPPEDVEAVLQPLLEVGFVTDAALARHPVDSGLAFYDLVHRQCTFWSREIYAQPFCRDLAAGRATTSQVLGWGIEFRHYVDHADTYMAVAVASCRDGWRMRQLLSRQLADEAGHGDIFLEGLVGCGLPRERILEAPPLPATQALMNFLTETASAGTLPYAACLALMHPEPTPPTAGDHEAFYAGLASSYPAARPLLEACARHALIDAGLGHSDTVLARVLAARAEVTRSEREVVVATIRDLAERFVLFFDQIGEAYLAPDVQIPRRPVRLASVA